LLYRAHQTIKRISLEPRSLQAPHLFWQSARGPPGVGQGLPSPPESWARNCGGRSLSRVLGRQDTDNLAGRLEEPEALGRALHHGGPSIPRGAAAQGRGAPRDPGQNVGPRAHLTPSGGPASGAGAATAARAQAEHSPAAPSPAYQLRTPSCRSAAPHEDGRPAPPPSLAEPPSWRRKCSYRGNDILPFWAVLETSCSLQSESPRSGYVPQWRTQGLS
jgi:hypothetical protein